jgi:serine protease Do
MNSITKTITVIISLLIPIALLSFTSLHMGNEAATEVEPNNSTSNALSDDSSPTKKNPIPAAETPVVSLKDFNDAIVKIAEAANPSVVTITTERTQQVRVMDPFSMFFGNPNARDNTREYVQRGLGSGVVVSEEGYIITNNHVIENTDEIKVRLFDGQEVEAELIGTDPMTDIAVLKIDLEDVPAIPLGDSDQAKVGSFVLAIGSPLSEDLAHTVSFGIVSARGRSLQLTAYGDYIQTDAAINPGNSGGALIDMNGTLVGINSAIASRSGGNDGIGFAIPMNLAKRIMDDLIEDGSVSRGYLGMYTAGELDPTMAEALGLDVASGIIVGQVETDGPADKAGLEEEDIIVGLNDKPVKNWDAFRTKIASFKPKDVVELNILRDGKPRSLEVIIGERPSDQQITMNAAPLDLDEDLGFSVRSLTESLRNELRLSEDLKGVVVQSLKESSEAYERGLRNGDIISAVKRKDISSAQEFYDAVQKSLDEGDRALLLTVERDNLKQFIAFRL